MCIRDRSFTNKDSLTIVKKVGEGNVYASKSMNTDHKRKTYAFQAIAAGVENMIFTHSGESKTYTVTLTVTQYHLSACFWPCLLYTSPSPRDLSTSRMPSSA
eukprot:TRINITY_DN4237_c0_g1_i4.p1 TRINITY_DN4237_c0_g1~~TRINITY_DN4237_c0_g1_i4.p1  ORF type:complete len:102 (+),score=14.81 TRINITY_DN4237_c0_g1_i4:139-444(+)